MFFLEQILCCTIVKQFLLRGQLIKTLPKSASANYDSPVCLFKNNFSNYNIL